MSDAGRVLVLETASTGRGELVRILVEAGYSATPADSWQAVLAAVEEGEAPLDLVVTPWHMDAGIEGLRLARWVAERRPGVATLILFTPRDLGRMEDAPLPPGVRLLADPCDPRQLLSCARSAMAEASALREARRPAPPAA